MALFSKLPRAATTLIQATDGNLYGIVHGLTNGGMILKVTPGSTLTTFYDFCTQPVNDKSS